MSCNCDIRTTIERLESQGLIVGDRSPLNVLLTADIDVADKDSFLFIDHMLLEESLIFPFLEEEDRAQLMMEHLIIRNFKLRGETVPEAVFTQHKNREKVLFANIARAA